MKKTILSGLAMATAFAFAAPAAAQCGDGKDRRVQIVNDTSHSVMYLYGSNVGADSWQEDVLGNRTIPPGGTVTVNWDDGSCYCNFDFKVEFSDNTSTIRRRFNVCTQSSFRIYE